MQRWGKHTIREITLKGTDKRQRFAEPFDMASDLGEVFYIEPDGSKRLAGLHSFPLYDTAFGDVGSAVTDPKTAEAGQTDREERMILASGKIVKTDDHENGSRLLGTHVDITRRISQKRR